MTLPSAEQVTPFPLSGSQGCEARTMAGLRSWRTDTARGERKRRAGDQQVPRGRKREGGTLSDSDGRRKL